MGQIEVAAFDLARERHTRVARCAARSREAPTDSSSPMDAMDVRVTVCVPQRLLAAAALRDNRLSRAAQRQRTGGKDSIAHTHRIITHRRGKGQRSGGTSWDTSTRNAHKAHTASARLAHTTRVAPGQHIQQ